MAWEVKNELYFKKCHQLPQMICSIGSLTVICYKVSLLKEQRFYVISLPAFKINTSFYNSSSLLRLSKLGADVSRTYREKE